MKILLTIVCAGCFSLFSQEQNPIEVTDKTVKIGPTKTEELYFGFQEGDIIIFSFEELRGKSLKEIEITELPSSSKYSNFKPTKVEDKRIEVRKKGMYKFSFKNGAMTGRICKIHIQRIPANSQTANFNTDWKWKTIYDTTYIPYTIDSIVGFDSTYIPYVQKELVRTDTSYFDQTKNERIHTLLNKNGDRSVVWFDFPQEMKSEYITKEIISWAWWFGTEDSPNISGILGNASELAMNVDPVAGLALGILSLTQSTAGKNIKYFHLPDDEINANLFIRKEAFRSYNSGDGSSRSHRLEESTEARFYLGFDNDHTYPVDVNIQFVVVMLTKTYEDVTHERLEVKPRTVVVNKIRIEVQTQKVRVNAE